MLGKAAVMRRLGKPVFNCSIDLLKKGAYSPLGSWSPQRRTYSKVETFDYNSFGKTLDLECSLKESSGTATNVQNLPERGAKGLSLLEGIKEIMDTNPDHVVLTQVGSFYEVSIIFYLLDLTIYSHLNTNSYTTIMLSFMALNLV